MKDENKPIPFEEVRSLFRSGGLWHTDETTLLRCLRGLAMGAETNHNIRHHHTIIASAIQGILLTRLIDRVDRRNTILTYVLIGIGVVAIAASLLSFIG